MDAQTQALYAQINAQQFLIDAIYVYLATQTRYGGEALSDLRRITKEQLGIPSRLPSLSPALEQALELKPEVARLIDEFFREIATLTHLDLPE
jgi:hypothetical protein